MDNISRKYYLDKTEICVLDKVSFQIYKGDFLVIAGPSGSGKTTLLNIIGCIDKPTLGKVFFDGIDITDTPISCIFMRFHRRFLTVK